MFFYLVDESRDVSYKEQMTIVLRCFDILDQMVKHFFGVIDVADINTITPKVTIETILTKQD